MRRHRESTRAGMLGGVVTEPLPRPADNIPEGWRVLWCPECAYSVTFTDAAWITYTEDEWNTLLWQEAQTHDC